jgi:hypothetical protein
VPDVLSAYEFGNCHSAAVTAKLTDRRAGRAYFEKRRGIATTNNGLLHAMAEAGAHLLIAWFNQHLALLHIVRRATAAIVWSFRHKLLIVAFWPVS